MTKPSLRAVCPRCRNHVGVRRLHGAFVFLRHDGISRHMACGRSGEVVEPSEILAWLAWTAESAASTAKVQRAVVERAERELAEARARAESAGRRAVEARAQAAAFAREHGLAQGELTAVGVAESEVVT